MKAKHEGQRPLNGLDEAVTQDQILFYLPCMRLKGRWKKFRIYERTARSYVSLCFFHVGRTLQGITSMNGPGVQDQCAIIGHRSRLYSEL